jgi:hypothetical protein
MKIAINVIILLCCLFIFNAVYADINDKVLKKAEPILPNLKEKINQYWKELKYKHYIGGQIEQESCASLKKCWNPNVELKTEREYGFGLAQITIAYDKLGKERFNNFLEAKRKYKELTSWRWEDRFNVDYQLTFILLEDKRLYNLNSKLFKDEINKMAGLFVSYNAGMGTILQRRALCERSINCNKNVWFGGLSDVHLKYEEQLLYGQKLYEMRNRYPFNIIFKKSEKYKCLIY